MVQQAKRLCSCFYYFGAEQTGSGTEVYAIFFFSDNMSKTRRQGDVFASFLPGMSMGLCKVITGDSKQGQMITVVCLQL